MRSRKEAAAGLWRDWRDGALRWWREKSAGGPGDQAAAWFAAAGASAALAGLAMWPRLTVLACAGAYVWSKIEERRRLP